ncbi:MAG: hypothetical protein JWM11_7838 [Planctomycetaceae bacterium]|nr:hypothetical protein [Planctomycetaceae bacterium]
MAAAPRMKLADKQEIYKKVLSSLKKRYPSVSKLPELPVLETMLFAVCLENATAAEADTAYKRLLANFHDLNEVRVSSIEELEAVFHGMSTPDWRAMRIRGILGHVFEATYSFEFDGLKRKTLELAAKQLAKIKELTPFVRDYTLHATLGAHVIPLDDALLHAVEFLDLHAETGGLEATAESLKPLVRKADGTEFSSLLRELATDPKLRPTITVIRQAVIDGAVLPSPLIRFEKLLKGEPIKFDPPPKKSVEKKEAEKREVERKDAEKKDAEKKDLEKKELEKKELEKKDKGGLKTEMSKSESGKKTGATKVEIAKAESSKIEPASKIEAAKVDQSKGKSAGSKAEVAKTVSKPESSKHELVKPDVEAAKPAASKVPAASVKPEKKLDAATDKGIKPGHVKPTTKSGKTESVKNDAVKSPVASPANVKPEPAKGKLPATAAKKEPAAVAKKEEAAKPVVSGKSATKVTASPPKSSSRATAKPADLKSSKKPASKSGK